MEQPAHFDGADYQPRRDLSRLTRQIDKIKAVIADGEWISLAEISELTGFPHASVSAQLRNLRKKRFGGHTIERSWSGQGLYLYRFVK